MFNIDEIKAEAVSDFVGSMISAFEAGFLNENIVTLAEVHQIARNHIHDTYGIETPNIVQDWGEDVAKQCGLSTK